MPMMTIKPQEELEKELISAIAQFMNTASQNPVIEKALILARNLQILLRKPIKLALGGEFSSGKSTLTKVMLGQHVVKIQASASAMPTVCFKYDKVPGFRLITDNDTREIDDPALLTEDEMRAADRLDVMLNHPFLEMVEIYDTPGTSDPTRDTDQLLAVADQVDFMIWCTNATQAWRESERQMWVNIPEEVKEQSLLIVTHVDLPNVQASIDRLMKRLIQDAGPLFNTIFAVDLLSAVKARSENCVIEDATAWKNSGADAVIDEITAVKKRLHSETLHTVQDALNHEIKDALNLLLSAPQSIEVSKTSFLHHWKDAVHTINEAGHKEPQPYIEMLKGCLAYLKTSTTSANNAQEITERLIEANEELHQAQKAGYPKAVLKQLDWEFEYLAQIKEIS